MNEKIVYVLGAGFSAPLGLPLVGDFLFKSKDMYFADPSRFGGFKEVFEVVGRLSRVKNYFDSDLFNIEEILSLIEMEEFLKSRSLSETFISYIKEVINFYTPPIAERYSGLCSNWNDVWLGHDGWTDYLRFIANLLCYRIKWEKLRVGENSNLELCRSKFVPERVYNIVSLNYDRVVENAVEYLSCRFPLDLSRNKNPGQQPSKSDVIPMTKLHGCVSAGTIVPPTWNKGAHPGIAKEWADAFVVLRDANEIRFIGYSLPDGDAYVRYLLKAACVNAEHLKKIDVICLDSDGTVEARYRRVISFRNLRFRNTTTQDYLRAISNCADIPDRLSVQSENSLTCNSLEQAHEGSMNAHAS